jgi:hypothetical protein
MKSRQRKDMILSVSPLPSNLRIVEPEEVAVVRQQLGKYVAMTTNTHATVE